MSLYEKNYVCGCGERWTDTHTCLCDDRCPNCNRANEVETFKVLAPFETEIRVVPMKRVSEITESVEGCDIAKAEFFTVFTVVLNGDGSLADENRSDEFEGHLEIDVDFQNDVEALRYAEGLKKITAWNLDTGGMI